MRLLLVSEHEEFTGKLQKIRGQEQQAMAFRTVDEFLRAKPSVAFDAAIADEQTFGELSKHFVNPIFVLSDAQHSHHWMAGLNNGADGVLFKEVPVEASLSQVAAFLRRLENRNAMRRELPRFGMTIDLDRYLVEVGGQNVDVTLTELKVLKQLATTQEDKVISRAWIQSQVFGQLQPGNRSLDVHVCSLRKKLKPHGMDVESVRGVGYRLRLARKS